MGFDENISILFNDFLTTPHLNTKALTARELKKRIDVYNLKDSFNKKNKYSLLRKFLKIWPVNDQVIKYIEKDMNIFIETFRNINDDLHKIETGIDQIMDIIYRKNEYHYNSMMKIVMKIFTKD